LSLRLLRSTYYIKYASLEALLRLASGAFYFAILEECFYNVVVFKR